MLDLCSDQGLGFTNYSPLSGGWLTGKYKFGEDYPEESRMTKRPEGYLSYWNEETFARIDKLSVMAFDLGVSTAGLSLAWLYHHPGVTSSIVGPRRPEHFSPVRQALGLDLTESQWREVGAVFVSGESA